MGQSSLNNTLTRISYGLKNTGSEGTENETRLFLKKQKGTIQNKIRGTIIEEEEGTFLTPFVGSKCSWCYAPVETTALHTDGIQTRQSMERSSNRKKRRSGEGVVDGLRISQAGQDNPREDTPNKQFPDGISSHAGISVPCIFSVSPVPTLRFVSLSVYYL